jgi:hypothetical protein
MLSHPGSAVLAGSLCSLCAVLCCAVLCCAVLCCAVLCCAVLCCAVLCCAVLSYPILSRQCCAVLCCAVLCCAILSYPIQAVLRWFVLSELFVAKQKRWHSSPKDRCSQAIKDLNRLQSISPSSVSGFCGFSEEVKHKVRLDLRRTNIDPYAHTLSLFP